MISNTCIVVHSLYTHSMQPTFCGSVLSFLSGLSHFLRLSCSRRRSAGTRIKGGWPAPLCHSAVPELNSFPSRWLHHPRNPQSPCLAAICNFAKAAIIAHPSGTSQRVRTSLQVAQPARTAMTQCTCTGWRRGWRHWLWPRGFAQLQATESTWPVSFENIFPQNRSQALNIPGIFFQYSGNKSLATICDLETDKVGTVGKT